MNVHILTMINMIHLIASEILYLMKNFLDNVLLAQVYSSSNPSFYKFKEVFNDVCLGCAYCIIQDIDSKKVCYRLDLWNAIHRSIVQEQHDFSRPISTNYDLKSRIQKVINNKTITFLSKLNSLKLCVAHYSKKFYRLQHLSTLNYIRFSRTMPSKFLERKLLKCGFIKV